MTGIELRGLSHDEVQLQFRQLSRNITREGLGAFISGILACKLPWLLLSGIYNIANFVHYINIFRQLKKAARGFGIRIKKRIIAKGMLEGALTKLGSSIITLGHDDLVTATGAVSSWIKHAGLYIADHLSVSMPASWTFNPQHIINWDSVHRMSHHILQHTTEIANWATDQTQQLAGIDQQKSLGWKEDGGDLAKQVYAAGSVQLASMLKYGRSMMSYCLAMCHFPEWQRKMQDELDEQVGDRMPEFEDIPSLPIVRAVIKEVLRWRPVTAGGFPHQLTKDDEHKGFFFTKGTIIHSDQWDDT
ncbi:cytochrome p450 [Fusarium phyllophilum]|uniref:Cytochrome p450 n=1 Tax=Fusarium phyllophilum TaxID=47803 RepID=A0A8H5NIF9_9HYPO|nr:cytochrome p450 [Fusarium phyllophilum]